MAKFKSVLCLVPYDIGMLVWEDKKNRRLRIGLEPQEGTVSVNLGVCTCHKKEFCNMYKWHAIHTKQNPRFSIKLPSVQEEHSVFNNLSELILYMWP